MSALVRALKNPAKILEVELEALRREIDSSDPKRVAKAKKRLLALAKRSKAVKCRRLSEFISIQSDGSVEGTHIYDQDGHKIGCVRRCVIDIDASCTKTSGVTATLDVVLPWLDLKHVAVKQRVKKK
jgi:hypothetical protein